MSDLETSILQDSGLPPLEPAAAATASDSAALIEGGAKVNFYDLTVEDLVGFFKGQGKEKFRAEQLYRWIYQLKEYDFQKMTNFSKVFRNELSRTLEFKLPKVVKELKSIDGTRKYLFEIEGGQTVETV